MKRLPQLKSFLKGGEAEQYRGVTVTYVAGRPPIMSIYQDGKLLEEINMRTLKTKAQMHALMQQKGFVKKTTGELAASHKTKAAASPKSRQRREQELLGKSSLPSFVTMFEFYAAVAVLIMGITFSRNRRRR